MRGLSGGQTAIDMAVFAEAKHQILTSFLQLKKGVPSHDTFSRVFRQLDRDQFPIRFQKFVARFGETHAGVIAIDGKTLRRPLGLEPCTLGAAHDQRLVLRQTSGARADCNQCQSNESAAVLKLLGFLSLRSSIVTTDALNCRRDIAQKIVENEGNYVLALKGNQRTLHADVRDLLDELSCETADKHSTVDSNHGRIETRTALISADIKELDERHRWSGLAAVGKVVRTRDTPTSATTETAYYLMSAVLSPERLGQVVRSH